MGNAEDDFEHVADRIERHAFLYDDPRSFRAGVRAAVRAFDALLRRIAADARTRARPDTPEPGAPAGR